MEEFSFLILLNQAGLHLAYQNVFKLKTTVIFYGNRGHGLYSVSVLLPFLAELSINVLSNGTTICRVYA